MYSGYWVSFLGVKQWSHGIDHPPLSSTQIEYGYCYTSTSLSACLACYRTPLPCFLPKREPRQCSQYGDYAMVWTSEESWFNSWQQQETFLFSLMSTPPLGPSYSLFNGFHITFPQEKSSWVLKLLTSTNS